MWSELTLQLIEAACQEDLGPGDLTSSLLPPSGDPLTARVVSRQPGIICGLALGPAVCATFSQRLGCQLAFQPARTGGQPCHDGDRVQPGTTVATVHGPRPAVLAAERTLLNFLGRMSGVATLTNQYVTAARQTNPDVRILDTRKTIPGWRELDKYAVLAGGGDNHRIGLHDAVLIKDNHLAGIPTPQLAARLTKMLAVHWPPGRQPSFIEVEVDTLDQFAEVCSVPTVNIILLDNFSLDDMRTAVHRRDARGLRGSLQLEASGGVTLETIAAIAATGVDRISVGALTHSALCLDLGLDS